MAASNAKSQTKVDKTIAIETIDPFPSENSSPYDTAANLDESNYIRSARLNIDDEIASNLQETSKNTRSAVGLDNTGSASDSPRSEINSLGDLCGYQIYSPGFRAINPELKTFPTAQFFFFRRRNEIFHGRETFVCPSFSAEPENSGLLQSGKGTRVFDGPEEGEANQQEGIDQEHENGVARDKSKTKKGYNLYLFYYNGSETNHRGWWITEERMESVDDKVKRLKQRRDSPATSTDGLFEVLQSSTSSDLAPDELVDFIMDDKPKFNYREKPVLFSPSDVATPDLATGWVSYPRHELGFSVVRNVGLSFCLLSLLP